MYTKHVLMTFDLIMIFLNGGESLEIFFGISGGVICSLALFIFLVNREIKNSNNDERINNLTALEKIIRYFLMIVFISIISFFSFFIFALIFGLITYWFTKL